MMSLSEILKEFISKLSTHFSNLSDKAYTILNYPVIILTLIGFITIFILLIKAKNIKFTPKMLTTIGIALSLTVVLNMIKIYKFPQGGGITLASMIPLLLIAYMYGPLVGMLSGFIFGILSLFLDPFILNPAQVLFDYPLPYMALGIAGFFKNKRILGAIIAIFTRFIFHFIAGVVFFGNFAPTGVSPWIYSLTVNGSLISLDGAICILVLSILPLKRLINLHVVKS